MTSEVTRIGIICGGGTLPADVAKGIQQSGQSAHLIGIDGEADEQITQFPHSWIKWGEIGKLFSILKSENCTDVIIIGHVTRPDLTRVRMDLGALKLLPFIMRLRSGGDDSILTRIAHLFEEKGHRVRSVLDLVPSLAASIGPMTTKVPDQAALEDISMGLQISSAMGQYDVGQAVVIASGHVIAVEAAEGTDQMLERCQTLRQWGRKGAHGVLIKVPKPSQDRRVDLPTIGPKTIELAAAANLAGLAVAAAETLIADKEKTLDLAKKHGLFVYGVEPKGNKA